MGDPAVAIDVDEETGVWRTDGVPMVYLPRHFLVNNHVAMEQALGRGTYRRILRAATHKSAVHWCEAAAAKYDLQREAAFRFYFERLSQRGWGQFSVEKLDAIGKASLTLRNSIFALERRGDGPVCYMFEGFLTGALQFLMNQEGAEMRFGCEEVQCSAEGRRDNCRFEALLDN